MAAVGRVAIPSLLAGVAVGILTEDGGLLDARWALPLLAGAVAAALVGSLLRHAAIATLVTGLLAGLALGGWAGASAALPAGSDSIGATVGTEMAVRGTVLDDPRPRQSRQQLVLGDLAKDTTPIRGRLLLWLPRGIAIEAGDRLAVTGVPELPEDFDGFAYREYLARQGVGAILRAQAATIVGHDASPLQIALRSARAALLDGFLRRVPEPEASLGAGILLGVRSGIAPETSDAFAAAGLTHVVAISGWNIAIVAALVAAMLRPLRGRRGGRWIIATLTAGSIGGYVMLTGASPSVVRAGLMAGAMLIAQLGGSRTQATAALMLAALVMLVAAPPVLWDVGFQLSLLATVGLILLGGSVERRLAWLPGWAREPIALTLASQVTTLPVILLNFERLSLVAPLANVAVAPLVPIAMLVGSLAMLAGTLPVVPLLGDAFGLFSGGATWLVLRLMSLAGIAAASVPFASLDVSAPAWFAAGYYPALAVILVRHPAAPPATAPATGTDPGPPDGWARVARIAFHPAAIGALIVTLLAGIGLAGRPDGRMHVVALDIGQGDAILLTAPSGDRMLIDGGPDPELTLRRLGEVMPFWDRRIDVVLLTHPHEDHVAGLVEVLRRFEVRRILEPGRPSDNPTYARFMQLAADEPGGIVAQPRAGDQLWLDRSARVEVLYPSVADAAAPLLEDDVNNGSLVVLLRCGGFSALLTGDAEGPVEALLAARALLPDVDLLKVGHHGSESSTTAALLAATRPQVGLISAGIGNEYGHPRPATLAALSSAGVAVMRTDLDGTIDVASDGLRLDVRSGRGSASAALPAPAAGCGRAGERGAHAAGSIGPWLSPTLHARARSSPPRRFRAGSSATRRVSVGSRRRLRGWCRSPGFPSMSDSSRSPPCCTTSTSSRPATVGNTAWSAPPSSTGSAIRSLPRRWPHIL